MPANVTEERRRLLRLYGAEIVESPAEEGSNGAVRLALELAERDPSLFMPFQYANEANPRAHYEGTGAEIADALDRVDVLVAGLGTGGTLMGAGERLREAFPDVVVAAAEPLPGDEVMGLRSLADGYVPPILDVSKLDRKLLVSNAESVAGLRLLLEREGVFGGVSSGAVIHAARRLAERARRGRRRLRARRRRLEVPLGRVLGRRTTSRPRWSAPSGGSPRRGAAASSSSTRGRRRRTRPAGWSSSRTASPSATSADATPPRRRTASSSTSTPRPGSSRTRATSSPSSTRTCPRRRARRARTCENVGLWAGRPYLIYTVRTGELAALADRGRCDRADAAQLAPQAGLRSRGLRPRRIPGGGRFATAALGSRHVPRSAEAPSSAAR